MIRSNSINNIRFSKQTVPRAQISMHNKPSFASCLIHIKAIPVYITRKSQTYNKASSYFRKADGKNQRTYVA